MGVSQIGVIVGLLAIFVVASGKFLWFEKAPAEDDPCTIVQYGLDRFELREIHWPAKCRDGGLLWYGTTGRLHSWFYVDLDTKQEFELCLTAGLADRMHVFYDYAGHYLEPMTMPVWYMRPRWWETCKKSINGTMDLIFESPLNWVDYYSFISFNITLIDDYQPKPQPPIKPWIVGETNLDPEEIAKMKPPVSDDDWYWGDDDEEEYEEEVDAEDEEFPYWEEAKAGNNTAPPASA